MCFCFAVPQQCEELLCWTLENLGQVVLTDWFVLIELFSSVGLEMSVVVSESKVLELSQLFGVTMLKIGLIRC